MKIITIEEEAWKQLNSRINAIADYLKRLDNTSYDDLWLNNHEICQYLHISEKTLWRMRTKGEIAYSKIYGQYFYTIGAIKDMLNANAKDCTTTKNGASALFSGIALMGNIAVSTIQLRKL